MERGHVEVEELPAQALVRRRRARVGTPTASAAIALVALLAAGFGVMGGRPEQSAEASPPGGGVAVASPSGAAAPSGPVRTPAVTPDRPCGTVVDRAPDLLLVVDGAMNAAKSAIETEGPPATPVSPRGPVQIPADAVVEIWVGGSACAVAWHIALSVEGGAWLEPVSIQPNPGMDPALARQNRFRLPLTQHRFQTGELELRAGLDFPEMSIVATWPIEFLPFERPRPRLLLVGQDTYFPTVEGCDVVMTLRNEVEEVERPCARDLDAWLPPAIELEPGTRLRLIFEGWTTTQTTARCGTAPHGIFVEAATDACWPDPQDGVEFPAPQAGEWIIAAEACATQEGRLGRNRICGTWFAAVDTR